MSRLPYFGGKSPVALPWIPLPYMDEYLENLVADEKTEVYIRAIKVGLTHFGIYASQEGIKHPEELERHHILRFQAYLSSATKGDGEPLAKSYRQQVLKYVRGWIKWMLELQHITNDPWVRIRISYAEKKPKPLEDDEIDALFEAHRRGAFKMSPFFYHRRETILVLLYAWGLRLSELQSLTVRSMDLRHDFVTVRNKGGGTKNMPYGEETKAVIRRWLANRAKHSNPDIDALLIDSTGKALSSDMIYKIVTECGIQAGVTINPHRLRDTFGTKMLDNDVPVERIMKMMGHTKRSRTLSYARVGDPKIKESHDRVMDPMIAKLTGGKYEPQA